MPAVSDTVAPYTTQLANLAAGSYTLTARATDNRGSVATSAPVSVAVEPPNALPVVQIAVSTDDPPLFAPAAMQVTATASDAGGTIAKVEILRNNAVAATLMSEPTFAAVMNATDIFELNGEFHYWQDIVMGIKDHPYSAADLDENDKYSLPEDVNVHGSDASLERFINGAMVGTVSAVPEGRFTRLAAIVDPAGYEMTFRARSPLFEMYRTFRQPAKIIQYHPQRRVTLVSPVAPLRGILQYNYIVFFRFHPTHSATVDMMLDSLAPDAAVPVPAQIGSQSIMAVTNASERPTGIPACHAGGRGLAPVGPANLKPS